jgi:paired amphipathic helix protein Sin3a
VQQSSSRFETIPGQSAAGPGYPQPILSYLPPGYTLPGTGAGATGQLPAPVAQETPEEKLFFDRIAEFIDDKFTYYEFLKLLNLYTQEIIDLPTLVSRAWLFIGSAPDLWLDFREVVGWKDGNTNGRVIENGEWIVENVPAIDKRDKMTDLTRCEASGPSYRKLPKHVRRDVEVVCI